MSSRGAASSSAGSVHWLAIHTAHGAERSPKAVASEGTRAIGAAHREERGSRSGATRSSARRRRARRSRSSERPGEVVAPLPVAMAVRVDAVERRLQRGVRDRPVEASERRPERRERLQQRGAALEVGAERDDGEHRRPVELLRHRQGGGDVGQDEPERDVVGRVGHHVARVPQRGGRVVERVEDRAAEHERADLVEPVLEGDDDAEVARAAAEAPEEVGVLGRRGA